ncbi:MAG: prealbumin-like fold domain-containing protein [Firmicutes bacterium]|nr:prealbumin-like fold domain-containing protein [Bacillota bacterium]
MNTKFRIPGVKIGLFDCNGKMVACGRTNRNGEATFDGIPLGQYLVKQLDGPNGFDNVGGDCVRVNLRRGRECDQVNFVSVQRHGAIKVTKWGYNETVCNFDCGCGPKKLPCNPCHNGRCNRDTQGRNFAESDDVIEMMDGDFVEDEINQDLED